MNYSLAPLVRLLALAVVATGLGCQPIVVPADVPLTCDEDTPCPEGQACALSDQRCVDATDPCILLDGATATRRPDGAGCGDAGGICVDRVCVAPRCGDGLVTSPETCDGTEGCRADCTACGDGALNGDEGCDDGAGNSDTEPGGCRSDCRPASCGDDVIDPGETCDGGLGCRDDCSFCGDGTVDDDEECDSGEGNDDDLPNACRERCVVPICGDGVVDAGETCDGGLGCRDDCSFCGDGTVDDGEECDSGTDNDDDLANACRTDCVAAFCGDGVVDDGETCDGGLACREGCSFCGDGTLDEGEACDTGVLLSDRVANACRSTCALPGCGDGAIDAGEACDDGASNSATAADACRPVLAGLVCQRATCGDGVVDRAEACDTGGVAVPEGVDGPGCSVDCREMRCGDGIVDATNGEACDDANGNPADGCDACRRSVFQTEAFAGDVGTIPLDGAVAAPFSVAADESGVIYIGENGSNRVRRLIPGRAELEPVAGNGTVGNAGDGDGGSALLAAIGGLTVVVPDGDTVYIAEGRGRVRRVDAAGVITTVAGGGEEAPETGGLATEAKLGQVRALAVATDGQVYFAELGVADLPSSPAVWRIEFDGTLTRMAPLQSFALAVDGSLLVIGERFSGSSTRLRTIARDADDRVVSTIITPDGLGLDALNAIAVASPGVYLVTRPIDSDIHCVTPGAATSVRVAGRTETLVKSSEGDGGPALDAFLHQPRGVGLTPDGDILIAESGGHRVRRVAAAFRPGSLCTSPVGTISTLAGNGSTRDSSDGNLALTTPLLGPTGLHAVDNDLIVADTRDHRLRLVQDDGVITTLFGNGAVPDLVPDDVNRIFSPRLLTDDGAGGFFVMLGNDNPGLAGRNGGGVGPGLVHLARSGERLVPSYLSFIDDFELPAGLAVDARDGSILYTLLVDVPTEAPVGRLFSVSPGGSSVQVEDPTLIAPSGLASRAGGGVFVADAASNQVFLFDQGSVTAVVGTGVPGADGDGGPPLQARLDRPLGLAIDDEGALYIADAGNHRIRRVKDGVITTIAGTGSDGRSGDGGPAVAATLSSPQFLAVDALGRVAIVERDERTVRRIDEDGVIDTIVGRNEKGFGPFATARIESTALVVATGLTGHTLFSLGRADDGERRLSRFNQTPCGGAPRRDCEFADVVTTRAVLPPGPDRGPDRGDPGGLAFDRRDRSLLWADRGEIARLTTDDFSVQTATTLPDRALHGVAIHPDGSVLVADAAQSCVLRLIDNGPAFVIDSVVMGVCGAVGGGARLSGPQGVAVGPAGSIYVADTGNHRVLRLRAGAPAPELVIGDGDPATSGQGPAGARLFSVNAPRQLAVDRFGNLYIASTRRVRAVTNRGVSDLAAEDADEPDGDDGVVNIYGGGDAFPEPQTRCIEALAVVDDPADPDDGAVYVNDACFGTVARVRRVTLD